MLLALESRFALSYYEDPYGTLFKLQQRNIVNEYLSEFERLTNCVISLAPPLLLSCFISSLSPDLQREVQALQSMCLSQAMALAKLQEDKLYDRRRSYRTTHHSPVQNHSHHTTTQTHPPQTSFINHPPKLLVRRLSPEEIALKHNKGLCYYCDEKWSLRHHCHPRIHLLIAEEEVELPTSPGPPESPRLSRDSSPPLLAVDNPPHLSLNVMSGMLAPETFRVYSTVHHHRLTILVDGGSTHNFMQLRVAKFLGLPSTPITLLPVMVGNGGVIQCTLRYPQVSIHIQGHRFTTNLFGLDLSGADIVLGVQ